MNNDPESLPSNTGLLQAWWVFALRGAFALLFALLLFFVRALLGRIFFDPIMMVYLSLLLGSYVIGNGIIFGVAGIYSLQHHLGHWRHFLFQSLFAIGLGAYIAVTLFVTPQTLALLAGIYALGTALFNAILAFRFRSDRRAVLLLTPLVLGALIAGTLFLIHRDADIPSATQWLACFELLYAAILLTFAARMKRHAAPLVPAL